MSILLLTLAATLGVPADDEPPMAEAFRAEVERIAAEPLLGIDDADEWKARRPELQRQLREMLGLDPMPERTPLEAEVRDVIEKPDFVVETILFRSMPGLYVTGNLYRPKEVDGKLPAILYVCGHANVVKDGVIYGNKTHYQHHAEWYASNGYVCLVVDTLQLGEVPGLHHGTYREGKWWWQSRGYTPAGVEAWNGIRAIDYLCERPEVDPGRIGLTGRSGGGATSWWVGALDDRLATVIPVAGITDLRNHVIEDGPTGQHPGGVISGHCDCMFMVNTYRWDFDTVAALVAPKPMLVENTDRDPIFPEAGVRRVYEQLERVYSWYDASDRLGLVIGEGGHVDSEELRHPSFAFMDRWLKGKETEAGAIEEPDRTVPIEELKVLAVGEMPSDERNGTIDETFVPKAEAPPVPGSAEEWEALRDRWMEQLKTKVFAGWPTEEQAGPLKVEIVDEREILGGLRKVRAIDYTSQSGVRLRAYLVWPGEEEAPSSPVVVRVVGDEEKDETEGLLAVIEERADAGQVELLERFTNSQDTRRRGYRDLLPPGGSVAFVIPRATGSGAWPDERVEVQDRRRFALLGQTLDGMRVWDVRRGLEALSSPEAWEDRDTPPRFELIGTGDAAVVALWAAVFEPERVEGVTLHRPPATVEDGPAFLNLARVLDLPQALLLATPRRVVVLTEDPGAFSWAAEAADAIGERIGPALSIRAAPGLVAP